MDDAKPTSELRDNVIRLFPGRAWDQVGPLDAALAVLDRLDRLSDQIDKLAALMAPGVTPDQSRAGSQRIPEPKPRPLRPILVPGHPFPEDR